MSISQGNILSFAKQLFLALIVYCFLILCLGYEFGSGDQTEFIPLLRDNILNGYFKKDFFVQNYLLSGHDVRHGVIATCDIGNRFLDLNCCHVLPVTPKDNEGRPDSNFILYVKIYSPYKAGFCKKRREQLSVIDLI